MWMCVLVQIERAHACRAQPVHFSTFQEQSSCASRWRVTHGEDMKALLAAILIMGLTGYAFGQDTNSSPPSSADPPSGAKTPDSPNSRQGGSSGPHGDNY
jgi:hypothetical protein